MNIWCWSPAVTSPLPDAPWTFESPPMFEVDSWCFLFVCCHTHKHSYTHRIHVYMAFFPTWYHKKSTKCRPPIPTGSHRRNHSKPLRAREGVLNEDVLRPRNLTWIPGYRIPNKIIEKTYKVMIINHKSYLSCIFQTTFSSSFVEFPGTSIYMSKLLTQYID